MQNEINKKKENFLEMYKKNYFSQFGEDGIIEKALEIIGVEKKWCVEFGAWDGKHLSNTHYLMTEKGWSGVFIEGDSKKYEDLQKTYFGNDKAYCIRRMVSFEGKDCLQNILMETPIPRDFDVLSIDVDGNDYHIWDSFNEYEPRVVVIEFNPSIPARIAFVQPKDMKINQGSSILSFCKLGKQKGYEIIGATSHNAIFVKRELYSKFKISDNCLESMKDTKYETCLFQLYDGTLVIDGTQRMLWHGIKIPQKAIQVVPKIFRYYPGVMGEIRLFFFKIWRKLNVRF